jgi:acetate kinase
MQTVNPSPGTPPTPVADKAPVILTINGGSSSIKFALFSVEANLRRVFSGEVERIGTPGTFLTATRDYSSDIDKQVIAAATFQDGIEALLSYLRQRLNQAKIDVIGHRIVKGGQHLVDHQIITADVVAELHRMEPFDLDHLPPEIALINAFGQAFPRITQIACFDTAFFKDLPPIAQLLPIPRHYLNSGVRRFGFHGLSYTYLVSQLGVVAGSEIANGRVVIAHLGSGASMAAVHNGKPIDTTMAFTPTSGLVMGTRPGDVDPGLLLYLMKERRCSIEEMGMFISHQCGLLGLSETSSDMRDLLMKRETDSRAAEAVQLFCYQAKKHLCAMISTLGGLDTIVFAGGIGERSPEVRDGICRSLDFIGIKLDAGKNTDGCDLISEESSRVGVRIISTNEEVVIARTACSMLKLRAPRD